MCEYYVNKVVIIGKLVEKHEINVEIYREKHQFSTDTGNHADYQSKASPYHGAKPVSVTLSGRLSGYASIPNLRHIPL